MKIRNTHCVILQLVSVAILTTVRSVVSENVYEAIGRQLDLIKFQEMVNRDEVLRKILQHWAVTVCAPTEDVLLAKESWLMGRENKVVSYHVMNLLANKTLFPFTSWTTLAGAPPLYMTVKEVNSHSQDKEYYINNAKIIRTESYTSRDGLQQILYVIDEVLQPYSSASSLPPSAFDIIQKPSMYDVPEDLRGFGNRIKEDGLEELFTKEGNHTFFIPVGPSAWSNDDSRKTVDQWVIRGHVIPRNAIFTRMAGTESYQSEAYREDIHVRLSFVREINDVGNYTSYAQSHTMLSQYGHKEGAVLSRILRANIPVKNGVVHLIEHPLMVIDTTVWKFLNDEKHTRLTSFLQLVEESEEFKELLMSSVPKTLLAPSNEAIKHLPEETIELIRSNLTAFLKLHLVLAPVSTNDVFYEKIMELPSADNQNTLYFRVIENPENKTLIIDGGGVKAEAVQPDIGAIDGMVHIIDRFLGIPYQTIYQKLQFDPDLRITFDLTEQGEWGKHNLDDHSMRRNYTFFAPSNEAWAKLRFEMPSEYKQLTMGSFSYHVHKLLERHLTVGRWITYEELDRIQEIQMVRGKFNIRHTSIYDHTGIPGDEDDGIIVEWEGVEARIVRSDVQAINGVIHVIDNILMKKRDMTLASASKVEITFPWLLAMAFLKYILLY